MRIPALVAMPVFAVWTLLLTGCGGSGSGSHSTPAPKPQYIYSDGVVDGNAAVLSFPLTATGTSVVPTVAALPGTADIVRGMSTDGNGNLYVMTFQDANFSLIGVYVYAMSEGALTPTRSFTVDNLGYGDAMAVDHAGKVYLSIQGGPVAVFAETASGAASPTGLYNVGVTIPDMAIDASGNIYAQVDGSLDVLEFAANFSSLTPIKTLTMPAPFISCDPGIAVDASGSVYVASFEELTVFEGGSGSATSTIRGSSTGLSDATTVAVDSKGLIWINNTNSGGGSARNFNAFAPNGNGDVAPVGGFSSSTDFDGTFGTSLVIY